MSNLSDEEIRRDVLARRFSKYAKKTADKQRQAKPSKAAKVDLFRNGRRAPGSAYSRKS